MGGQRDVEQLLKDLQPRLSRALLAAYGTERGSEAFAEAMAWAWEHRAELLTMDNPAGLLYRVGQSKSRPRHDPPAFPEPADLGVPWVEPGLPAALRELTEHQRVCVVMVHGNGWTHREVADLISVATTTVQNHVQRGLANLRRHLEVVPDA
jgi:DNA-directed RNA polymerase specialized sigma24 family protein